MNQQEAAVHSEGPTLVIAGPGTGKTYTMIQRALYLICEKQVKPEEIMMVTYTVKASKELVTRLTNELSQRGIHVNLHDMYIGTFHHICRRILKEFREYTKLTRNHRETDQFEQQYLVYEALPEFEKIPRFHTVVHDSRLNLQNGPPIPISRWKQAGKVCDYVNGLSEELLDPEEMIRVYGGKLQGRVEVLGWMMMKYDRLSREKNFTDFSRLQTETYRLLTDHPEILRKLRSRIRYVMVDEYQDTDFIEEKLIHLFCGDRGSLFVVGDDDQSLYRFRGATVENILRFRETYEDCHQFYLSTNYRSTSDIVGFCWWWMEHPEHFSWQDGNGRWYRYRKGQICSAHPDNELSVVKITTKNDAGTWGSRVADFILKLKQDGCITDFNQVALLFDSVKGQPSVILQNALTAHHIPVYAPRAGRFFERKEISLLLGCLLLLFPDFSGHMDRFKEMDETEHITEQYFIFMAMAKAAMEEPANKALRDWIHQKEKALSESPDKPMDLLSLMYELFALPPFRGWMEQAAKGESPEARNLSAVTRLAARFGYFLSGGHGHGRETREDIHLFFSRYLRLWYENGVGEYEDEEAYAPSGSVSFLNIHQSKGLEYPVVIVGSLGDYPRNQDNLVQQVSHLVKGTHFYEPPEQMKYFDFQRKYYTAFSRAETLLVLACDEKGKAVPSEPFRRIMKMVPEYESTMDFQHLHFRSVERKRFKPRFAFTTQVALYEECPLKYKWLRVYRFAASQGRAALYGLVVHEAIEDVHRAILRGEGASVTPGAVYGWMMTDYITLSQTENAWLTQEELDDAFHEVLGYAMYRLRAAGQVEAAEYPLELVKDDYIMDGTIDLLEGNGGTVDVVDFKTGKKPAAGSPLMERYESQLMVYAYLVEQKAHRPVGRLILYFTGEDDSMVIFPMDKEKVAHRIASFDDTVHHIMEGDFCHKAERRGEEIPDACRYCDWKSFCWGK